MKTAEELTAALRAAMGDNLISVVLYGSAAAGDQTKHYSDVNILAVANDLSLSALKSVIPAVKKWTRAGNPPPLFFTEKRIRQAEDVFPIEFLDIRSMHRVLLGADPFAEMTVNTQHLRHQLEYELRGKLIQLRESYLETAGKERAVRDLLARSLSPFAVLFRAFLRLLGEEPPVRREDVFHAVNRHVTIDVVALTAIVGLRNKDKDAARQDPEALLEALLRAVEDIVDRVDSILK